MIETTTSVEQQRVETLGHRAATSILDAFVKYHHDFKAIARRAKPRFEKMEWREGRRDAMQRLDLYSDIIKTTVGVVWSILGADAKNKAVWTEMRRQYSALIDTRNDLELAETWFNSVTRRMFATVGVDPNIEFVAPDPRLARPDGDPVYQTYQGATTLDIVRAILHDFAFAPGYQDLERDARLVAAAVDAQAESMFGAAPLDRVEMSKSVFYRHKGAYLVGRVVFEQGAFPLILPLLHQGQGVFVDAALTAEDEAAIVFSFTRAYFHVDLEYPAEMVAFLKTVMPRRRVAELYIALGYNKHGKTELYRDLLRHLAQSDDKFVEARGVRGMVMAVFTLPSYDLVFKIIKDKFAAPKTSTRAEVMASYALVFHHDRAGRLIDAQEFEHLEFDRARFADELLEELLQTCGATVSVRGDKVVIRHLYTERRVTPLNIYVMEADPDAGRDAVIDYGACIKDLASTNIFPGDLFLKNFGVTRTGRVVFYDYDELCLLSSCNFRVMPSGGLYDDLGDQPWFSVAENDIFPEQFSQFLGLQGPLRQVFMQHHADLLDAAYWRSIQERHKRGEIVDIFPYRQSRRFKH